MIARNPQRGSAMLVSLILIAALLAGAGVLVSMQMSSNRSTDLSRTGMSALYCAEAGLAAARPVVAANSTSWAAALASGTTAEPAFLTTGIGTAHDLDGDGVDDFTVYLKDNDDELAPTANDLTDDIDQKLFVVSRCIKYPDTPKEVTELLQYSGPATCYQSQEGGCFGNGNSN